MLTGMNSFGPMKRFTGRVPARNVGPSTKEGKGCNGSLHELRLLNSTYEKFPLERNALTLTSLHNVPAA